ncbi:glucosaminidase domain-containing protein [Gammaproteobacteria bacterium]|nr:glucosaminidase domain-containing protein [Gammaproteobacteria bacterium]
MLCLPLNLTRRLLISICWLSVSWADCFPQQTSQHFIQQMNLAQQTAQADILAKRSKIIHLTRKKNWNDQEKKFLLDQLKKQHLQTTWPIKTDTFNQLLRHVDIVPAALLIAQAALESGYGRSRFAQQGCNPFGIWCYQPGCGLIPKNRPKRAIYEVKRFASLADAIKNYYAIFNQQPAFKSFRLQREQLRKNPQPHPSLILAYTLSHYATVNNYPERVIAILKKPNVAQYDIFPPKD